MRKLMKMSLEQGEQERNEGNDEDMDEKNYLYKSRFLN